MPNQIKIEAIVEATIQQVWDTWTLPEHITKWNFATDDWQFPRATNDLKVGGKFSFRMEAKDGSLGFDFEGIYDEVVHPQRISYRLADERRACTLCRILLLSDANADNIPIDHPLRSDTMYPPYPY
jgi:uncharacterized protein YndB with AHSA1/START domain